MAAFICCWNLLCRSSYSCVMAGVYSVHAYMHAGTCMTSRDWIPYCAGSIAAGITVPTSAWPSAWPSAWAHIGLPRPLDALARSPISVASPACLPFARTEGAVLKEAPPLPNPFKRCGSLSLAQSALAPSRLPGNTGLAALRTATSLGAAASSRLPLPAPNAYTQYASMRI